MTEASDPPYMRSAIGAELGVEFLERSEGRAVLRFPVQKKYTIPSGVLQGGMYGVFMDTAMAAAADGALSTATLQINLLRPTTEGYVVVTAETVRKGRNVIYLEAEVRNEDGVLLARGNQTGMVTAPYMPPPEAE